MDNKLSFEIIAVGDCLSSIHVARMRYLEFLSTNKLDPYLANEFGSLGGYLRVYASPDACRKCFTRPGQDCGFLEVISTMDGTEYDCVAENHSTLECPCWHTWCDECKERIMVGEVEENVPIGSFIFIGTKKIGVVAEVEAKEDGVFKIIGVIDQETS